VTSATSGATTLVGSESELLDVLASAVMAVVMTRLQMSKPDPTVHTPAIAAVPMVLLVGALLFTVTMIVTGTTWP
jgi:hypothetical protein